MPASKKPSDPADENPTFELAVPARGIHPRIKLHNRPETISNFIRLFGSWQTPIINFMNNYLKDGDVFIDVGANIGYFSIYASLIVGNTGKVHAIEPDSANIDLLLENISLNHIDNIELHRTAVSDFQGQATLFRGDYNAGAHSLLQKSELKPGSQVPVTTLDDLLKNERTPKLIKIDVQGVEVSVLLSMKELLSSRESKPAILLEFSAFELQRNAQLNELFQFIEEHNYILHAFIVNEGPNVVPPQIRRATLRQIADDLLAQKSKGEFDILLLPHRI